MSTRCWPTGWSFLRRERIGRDGDVYLMRWRLVQTPWFAIYLHRFDGPDHDSHLHDHPWPFVSLILRGGYVEEVPVRAADRPAGVEWPPPSWDLRTRRYWGAGRGGRINRHPATDRHRIQRLLRTPTWTLFFAGRRCRDWGFWVDGEFRPWRVYLGEE